MAKTKLPITRLARALGLAVVIAALAVLALTGRDRQGQAGGDVQKYHGKTFKVHRVIDGDTIDLDVPDGDEEQTRVRLWGVDTAETKAWGKPVAHFGPEATAFTERMLASGIVRIELQAESTRGKFGRLLAFVYTGEDEMLNEELLKAGMAYFDHRWRHRFYFQFRATEARARKSKLGLWEEADLGDMPGHVRQRVGPDR